MSIELDNIASGNSGKKINENFQKLETYINDNLYHRDGVEVGQSNQLELDLDMNGYSIINVGNLNQGGNSLLTVSFADQRFVNITGDVMTGPLTVLPPTKGQHPVTKALLDEEISNRAAADANIQSQLTGDAPLEASAFSPISWHSRDISNSVNIPSGVNAWSFGPVVELSPGTVVTVGQDATWIISDGLEVDGGSVETNLPTKTNLPLLNGWQADPDNPEPGYYKDSSGFVHLTGVVEGTNQTNQVVATMPVGFRPFETVGGILLMEGSPVAYNIYTSGDIVIYGSGGSAWLSTIYFRHS